MRFFSILLSVIILFVSCNSNNTSNKSEASKNDSLNNRSSRDEFLITEQTFGKIDSTSNFEQLQKLYGAENIHDTIDFGPEGSDTFQVTKIYSNTPKEIHITWRFNNFHKRISAAECYQQGSPYHTTDSIQIGTTLQKLLQANGQKINFYGTGWDYGGLITSFNKGKFERSTIFFQLADKPGMDEKLMGDWELNTDMPLVKTNLDKIAVSKISLSFEKNAK